MANISKRYIRSEQSYAGSSGNAWKKIFRFATLATGAAIDCDMASPVAQGDVVRFGVLPAGLEIHDALAIVSDAFSALTTARVGFAYVDGLDSTEVPQDDDYFHAALATHTAGRTRADHAGVAPLVLPREAYLILTVAGADHAAPGVLDVIVEGILRGNS